MVLARTDFLNAGIYEKVVTRIVDIIKQLTLNKTQFNLLDAGCGEGYYLNYIFTQLTNDNCRHSFIGLDISKQAIIGAAKRNKKITWVVGTNKTPPLCAESIDLILCVFGFYSFDGFKKILKHAGKVILVEPGANHLKELREIIYSEVNKSDSSDLSYAQEMGFTLIDTQNINFKTKSINKEQIQQLLLMTPHFFRANKEGRERAAKIDSLNLTVDMVVRVLEV